MSYDLLLVPRNGKFLGAAELEEYFMARPNYRCDAPRFSYVNENTGVYFDAGW